jgi:hypothetical protein
VILQAGRTFLDMVKLDLGQLPFASSDHLMQVRHVSHRVSYTNLVFVVSKLSAVPEGVLFTHIIVLTFPIRKCIILPVYYDL